MTALGQFSARDLFHHYNCIKILHSSHFLRQLVSQSLGQFCVLVGRVLMTTSIEDFTLVQIDVADTQIENLTQCEMMIRECRTDHEGVPGLRNIFDYRSQGGDVLHPFSQLY